MKYFITALCTSAVLFSCKKKEAYSLFNYQDLSEWHIDVPEMDTIPDSPNPFIIRNDMLVSLGEPRGHPITDKTYKNFRLDVEYRFPGEPGNCGVLVQAPTLGGLYQMFPNL